MPAIGRRRTPARGRRAGARGRRLRGRSNEHAISCVSAGSILRNLDPERFEVVAIGITRKVPGCSPTATRPRWRSPTGGCPKSPPSRGPNWRCRPIRGAAANWSPCRPAPVRCWRPLTWCSPCCTAPTARTAPSRVCSNSPACRMWGPVCWPAPPAWTRSSPRSCSPPRDCRSATTRCCAPRARGCGPRSASGWGCRCSSNPPGEVPRSV